MNNSYRKSTIILVVTNKCNLHCKYCYEYKKDSQTMSYDTALAIARKELNANIEKKIVFDFFGGEPFIEFDMIKALCETIWQEYADREVGMSCITNGTLIDGRVAEWLKANSHRFFCHISLDGTPEMHRLNRGEKFPLEVAKLFADIWPNKATAKMTISKESICQTYEGIMYLNKLGLRVAPSLARGVDWDNDDLVIYCRELEKLLNYYTENPQINPIDMFNVTLAPVLISEMRECYCGAGYSMCAYSPNGLKFPCQMFMPISLDSQRWELIKDTDLRADKVFYSDNDCMQCPVQNLCKKCPGLNYKDRGNIGKRDKRLCGFIKAEYSTIANYKINILLQRPFETLTKEDYIELKAAAKLKERFGSQ